MGGGKVLDVVMNLHEENLIASRTGGVPSEGFIWNLNHRFPCFEDDFCGTRKDAEKIFVGRLADVSYIDTREMGGLKPGNNIDSFKLLRRVEVISKVSVQE